MEEIRLLLDFRAIQPTLDSEKRDELKAALLEALNAYSAKYNVGVYLPDAPAVYDCLPASNAALTQDWESSNWPDPVPPSDDTKT